MKLNVIGSGNVATYLGKLIAGAGHTVSCVFSRDFSHANELAQWTGATAIKDINELNPDVDIFLLAISDKALTDIIPQLRGDKLVVHTSGITPLSVFEGHTGRGGVFYPLQTLTKRSDLPAEQVPILIEANQLNDLNVLTELATSIGTHATVTDTIQRQYIHLAAVFANNFSNHLYNMAEHILSGQHLNFDLLKPLITETARKVLNEIPSDVQTGPAARSDLSTIEKHLQLLKNYPEYRQIYEWFSEHIREDHK